jgi:hypothetical protein
MQNRRRFSMPMRWLLGLLALAVCLIGGGKGLICFLDEHSDPYFICNYPGYKRLHEGMSAAAVKRILGEPTSKYVNAEARVLDPVTVIRLHAQERRLIKEDDSLDQALNQPDPHPAGLLEIQLKQNLLRCRQQREKVDRALAVLVKEVWRYEVPGWRGHIEVCIDVFGRVSAMSGGYA